MVVKILSVKVKVKDSWDGFSPDNRYRMNRAKNVGSSQRYAGIILIMVVYLLSFQYFTLGN